MSTPNPAPGIPKWLSRSIVTLLVVQVALLWTYGSLLQRQHDDIQSLREDVQALADSLYDEGDQDGLDSTDPRPHPAGWAGRSGPRPSRRALRRTVRAAFLQAQAADEGDPALRDAKKDLDAVRQSEQEALAKARKVQEQLSVAANIQKAEAKALAEARDESWKLWAWAGAGAAVVAVGARSLYRRRG